MGFVLSGGAKEPLHQGHGALPILRFARDLLSPRARQLVEFGLAIGIAGTPARFDPAALFQAQERRIERPLVEIQRAAGDRLDAFAIRRGEGIAASGPRCAPNPAIPARSAFAPRASVGRIWPCDWHRWYPSDANRK